MKKYDLSKIMKRAWKLVKKAGVSISEGLKKAWREAKEVMSNIILPALVGSEKQIAWATDIRNRYIEQFQKELQSEAGFFGIWRSKVLSEVLGYKCERIDDQLIMDFKRRGILEKNGNPCDEDLYNKEKKELCKKEWEKILSEETSAKWWIDRR